MDAKSPDAKLPDTKPREKTELAVLVALSLAHGLNDTVQSLIAASYPVLKAAFALDFKRIGLITLAFQATASLLQPVVGHLPTASSCRIRSRRGWRRRSPASCCCLSRIVSSSCSPRLR